MALTLVILRLIGSPHRHRVPRPTVVWDELGAICDPKISGQAALSVACRGTRSTAVSMHTGGRGCQLASAPNMSRGRTNTSHPGHTLLWSHPIYVNAWPCVGASVAYVGLSFSIADAIRWDVLNPLCLSPTAGVSAGTCDNRWASAPRDGGL
jgi:hypothetical protein